MEILGNRKLWEEPKIAIFISRKAKKEFVQKVIEWMKSVPNDVCFIGPFQSQAEKCFLHHVLQNGGKAVSLFGKSLSETLSREEDRAIDEGRLLLVSFFHREHFNAATNRLVNDVAASHAKAILFGQISYDSFLYPFYKRLCEKRKDDVKLIS